MFLLFCGTLHDVPRITEERRQARREQILDAARACVLEHGLEAVSMEAIIARSGLSTGAVYRYFKGKEEIIAAAVIESASEVGAAAAAVFDSEAVRGPAELIEGLLTAFNSYSRSGVGAAAGLERMPAALHGWSFAQTDPELKAAMSFALTGMRDRCAAVVRQWQAGGVITATAEPEAVAQLLLSVCLGFVAQRVLTGEADVGAHAAALAALVSPPVLS